MTVRRRDLLKLMSVAVTAGVVPRIGLAQAKADPYAFRRTGNVRLLHQTDTHAQLLPVYFREPSANIGVGSAEGAPPHLVGCHLLEHFHLPAGGRRANAFTYLDFEEAAHRYGRLGGFAHLKTLIDRLRAEAGPGNSLLLDGGDLWQGSGVAYWTQGADMVEASNILGVDILTGHWEFTYPEDRVRANLKAFKGEFLAQNVYLTEEAAFDNATAYDQTTGRVFKPFTIREIGGRKIGIVGQAFPYTPVAHPKRFMPDWTFGIRDDGLQKIVDDLRSRNKVDAVVLLSHNGMDVDLKLATRVRGIDVILGGHTHDAVPEPTIVKNAAGATLVTNAGSNGKFLAVLDLDVGKGKLNSFRYRLLPVFANLLKPDSAMAAYIEKSRAPYRARLAETVATAGGLLFRRGNFNGTMDQLICDALRHEFDAEIAFSPGFRWGTTILPGDKITMEDIMAETAITYPETYVQEMTGAQIKDIMEDVCDNLFNKDPYYQQGGDMVRVGGLDYACAPQNDINRRISDLTLDSGVKLEANKTYRVAGWASVNAQPAGKPVWEVVASALAAQKTAKIKRMNRVKLVGVDGNPGMAG